MNSGRARARACACARVFAEKPVWPPQSLCVCVWGSVSDGGLTQHTARARRHRHISFAVCLGRAILIAYIAVGYILSAHTLADDIDRFRFFGRTMPTRGIEVFLCGLQNSQVPEPRAVFALAGTDGNHIKSVVFIVELHLGLAQACKKSELVGWLVFFPFLCSVIVLLFGLSGRGCYVISSSSFFLCCVFRVDVVFSHRVLLVCVKCRA